MLNNMNAIFDTHSQAVAALAELRGLGIPNSHLSLITRHDDYPTLFALEPMAEDTGERAAKGLLGGAGVGVLFGLAAALIPGVGPFVAAGALATSLGATGGAIAAGAIVGAASGAIAGALTTAGYDDREAIFYGSEVEQGRVFLAVNADHTITVAKDQIRAVLTRHGGRTTALAHV